ncbi:type IV secretion system protein [Salmonella enterica]|nr:type IV secretion system protein [Salmonella enterica]
MSFTLVQDIFNQVDSCISTMVSSNVAVIISEVSPLVATCLTIKFMVQGAFSILNPNSGETLSTLTEEFIKVALILSFATAGGWFQTDLVNVALHLPDDFAGALTSPDKVDASGVPAIIDAAIDKGITIVDTAWEAADIFSSTGLAAYAIGIIMMIATIVLGGLGAGFVIMAKILLSVTLCFGPIAIFCLCWRPVKGIFDRWLGSVINYGMVVILLALIFGFIMQMFDQLLSSLNSDSSYSAVTGCMSALLLMIVSVFVLFQIPQIAMSWGNGISTHVGEAARSMGVSMQTAGNMVSNGIFGGNSGSGSGGGSSAESSAGRSGSSAGNESGSGSDLTGKAHGSRGKQAA